MRPFFGFGWVFGTYCLVYLCFKCDLLEHCLELILIKRKIAEYHPMMVQQLGDSAKDISYCTIQISTSSTQFL
jgi:hypothetical protein